MTNTKESVMTAPAPLVSVLMSTHNVGPFVLDAVRSVLRQSFENFEFLIIDDASTDDTWARLQQLASADERIRLYCNQQTLGVPECINRLIPEALGPYVARMDADDIATPERFALQVAALDSGEVDICGSAYVEFPVARTKLLGGDLDDDEIKTSLLFEWSMMQPTVMMRRSLLRETHYRTEAIPAADYDLWVRLAHAARFRNLPQVLLLKRVHPGQISIRANERAVPAAMRVRRMALENAGISPTERELFLQSQIWTADRPDNWVDVVDTEAWLVKLAEALGNRPGAVRHVSRRWYKYCLKSAPFGLRTFRLFKRSRLRGLHPYSKADVAAVLLLSLLRIPYQSGLYWALYSVRPSAFRGRKRMRALTTEFRTLLDGRSGHVSN